jgi:4-diphosphocytidyl-2-C-methyl-D-erythritol kinase
VTLIVPAYAKLNLTLDVLGRRPDGYHDIDSVMQTISLHDLLSIERSDCRVFDVVGPFIEGENLILKAARELEGRVSRQLPFTIRLFKRIPIGAGLGGGSSDAAAFLKAANRLYDLKLSMAELAEIGAGLGQDLPFFLNGGTAHATGTGSTIQALSPLPSTWQILVVCPPIEVSTRAVYSAVGESRESAHRTAALISSMPLEQTAGEGAFKNDLEPVTRRLFPAFDEAINNVRARIPNLTMTGSGAGLFAVYDDRRSANAALQSVRDLGFPAWITHPVPAD